MDLIWVERLIPETSIRQQNNDSRIGDETSAESDIVSPLPINGQNPESTTNGTLERLTSRGSDLFDLLQETVGISVLKRYCIIPGPLAVVPRPEAQLLKKPVPL